MKTAKTSPVIVLIGSATLITGVATGVGLTTTIELQLLTFINSIVLIAIMMRKRLQISRWLSQTGKGTSTAGNVLSNTSWFIINRLGLQMNAPEKKHSEVAPQKPRSAEIDKIVPVIEAIDPVTGAGKVKYKEMEWHAKSANGQPIALGERVVIVARDILTLVVEKMEST